MTSTLSHAPTTNSLLASCPIPRTFNCKPLPSRTATALHRSQPWVSAPSPPWNLKPLFWPHASLQAIALGPWATSASISPSTSAPTSTSSTAVVALYSASLDLAVNIGANLNLIKDRSGAFLHEKMVDAASDKLVVIVDDTKLVSGFGDSGLAMSMEVV